MTQEFLVVLDSDGILRPMAGIWRNNEAGKISAEKYMKNYINSDEKIVLCEIIIKKQ